MEVALQDSYSRMATCYHLLFEHAPKGADIYSLSEVNNDIVLGIDLHSTNNHLGIYDQDDRELLSKRLPNDLAVVLGYIEPYRAELSGIAVESTYNWYWLVDGLRDHNYRVVLANPAANSQYNGLKYTIAGSVRIIQAVQLTSNASLIIIGTPMYDLH